MLWSRRQKQTNERAIAIAWHTANLSRAADLPKLSEYLRSGRPQTEQEREAAWLQIAARFGLAVRPHDKKRRHIYRGH